MNSGLNSRAAAAGSSKKSTVYVGGFDDQVNEQQLLDTFVTFGDIIEINMPSEPNEPTKHRGYAFLTFANPADAQEAIDNFDLNELPGYVGRGKFLKCSIANPNKYGNEASGDGKFDRPLWESEDWLQKYGKPEEKEDLAEKKANGTAEEGDDE